MERIMLPDLPKQNKHKEADFGLRFRDYVKHNNCLSGSYELKDSRGKTSIPFSEVTQEQIDSALMCNSDKGNLIRVIQGKPEGSPDFIYLKNSPAYIVIKYPNSFSIIGINTFLLEKERSKRKSLTESRATEISIKTVQLKNHSLPLI